MHLIQDLPFSPRLRIILPIIGKSPFEPQLAVEANSFSPFVIYAMMECFGLKQLGSTNDGNLQFQ